MVRVGNGTSGSVGGSLSGRIAAGTAAAAAAVLPPSSLLSTVWAPRSQGAEAQSVLQPTTRLSPCCLRRGCGGLCSLLLLCLHSVEAAAQSSGGLTAGSQLGAPETRLTRKQWRNRQTNKRRQKNKFRAGAGIGSEAKGVGLDQPCVGAPSEEPAGDQGEQDPSASMATELPTSRAASLRQRLEERLDSARFRYINQQLYTCSSQEAAQLFQEDPEALAVYHRGFARQVARWPEKPVQHFVRYLRNRPASLVVADFGCGDCTLARSLRNKVHCFDLVALDPQVTVCDMAQVPLEAESVDVAVFCLALMGTNLCEILEEANRVLRVGGTLLVAEVASRFPDVRAFVGALAQLGFRELKGFASLEDLLRVKGVTARILELNRPRVTVSPPPEQPPLVPPVAAAVATEGAPRRSAREPPTPVDEREAAAAEEEEEERAPRGSSPGFPSRGSADSEEDGESSDGDSEEASGGDVYFYYTVDERWIDYLERTEGGGSGGGGFVRHHTRPKVSASAAEVGGGRRPLPSPPGRIPLQGAWARSGFLREVDQDSSLVSDGEQPVSTSLAPLGQEPNRGGGGGGEAKPAL
nr:ribosomal RNA-processing protein 8 [Pogona vitticeps]